MSRSVSRRGIQVTALTVALGAGAAGAATTQKAKPILPTTSAALLTRDDIVYEGAFRVPATENGDTFSYGGRHLAYKPATGTLLVGSRRGNVAELTIPKPQKASRAEELPVAAYVAPFRDPAEGRIRDLAEDGASLDSLLIYNGRLYGTGLIYYDATNAQRLTHFSRSLDLSRTEDVRLQRVGDEGRAGFVAGYMATVPAEWRAALGGPAVTGQCCIPIVSRTSWGPSLFSWDPADLSRHDEVRVTPLLYYDDRHHTLGPWEGSNERYGGTTEMAGVAVIGGTRTVLFAGRNGTGPFCYGDGTADESKAREHNSGSERLCLDPVSADKGPHAYPYRLQFWAYDINDLAAVRSGKKDPWQVVPYAVWPFELPIDEPHKRLGSMTFDEAGRRLFISQLQGERDGYEYRPVIHVFRIA